MGTISRYFKILWMQDWCTYMTHVITALYELGGL